MTDLWVCRKGMEHAAPCKPTPDGEECACGCAADDFYCLGPWNRTVDGSNHYPMNTIERAAWWEAELPEGMKTDLMKLMAESSPDNALIVSRLINAALTLANERDTFLRLFSDLREVHAVAVQQRDDFKAFYESALRSVNKEM